MAQDTATEEVVTVDTLIAKRERLQGDLNEAQSVHDKALKAFDKGRNEPTEKLLELGDTVHTAVAGVDGVEAQIAVIGKHIERMQWESKSAELTAGTTLVVESVRDAVGSIADVLKRFNVQGLTVTVSGLETESPVFSVKPVGPDIPKAPRGAGRKGGGGGARGTRTTHSVTSNGQSMTPRDYVQAHLDQAAPAIVDYFAGNTDRKVNISHEAERIAKKLNDTFV